MKVLRQKGIKDFSIWDSVVDEKIRELDALEIKYRERGSRLCELENEAGMLRESVTALKDDRDQALLALADMEKNNGELKQKNKELQEAVSAMEHSTSWRVTKPVRKMLDVLRGNHHQ